MHRRHFLGTAFAAIANPLSSLSQPTDKKEVNVNELLKFFETKKIPEVTHIQKIIHANATKALVVFRQRHYGVDITKKDVPYIEQSQLEIYRALCFLLQQKAPGFDHVLCEEYIDYPQSVFLRERRKLLMEAMSELLGLQPTPTMEEALHDESKLCEKWEGDVSPLGFFGAGEVIAFTKGITPLPGGNHEVEAATDREIAKGRRMKDGNWRKIDYWVFERREDAVLEFVGKSKRQLSYVIFGANHQWENNIAQWNIVHPEEKFSALVISTNSVKKYHPEKVPEKAILAPFFFH